MKTILDILTQYRQALLGGLAVTLELCLVVWSVGLIVGTCLGVAGAKWPTAVGGPARWASFALSSIPVLVLLFWLHYPVQSTLDVVVNPFYTAAAALSLVNIFLVSDTVRGVLKDFPSQYILAARVTGLSASVIFYRVQLPIVLRQVLPSLLLLQVSMLQATLFASLISVDEIFRVAQRINAEVYKPVEIYSTLGLFFLAICLPLNGIAYWLRNRFTRNLSET